MKRQSKVLGKTLLQRSSPLALAAALSVSQAANAQIDDGKFDDAELFVVVGNRTPSVIEDLAASVTILNSDLLDTRLATSANVLDLLQFSVPGLGPQAEGGSGCGTLRGRNIGVFIDGVPTTDLLRQSSCNDVRSISPFALERVEVNRGATAVFGSGTSGGVIATQFRRGRSEDFEVDAHAGFRANTDGFSDSFSQEYYVGGGQKVGALDYYFGGSFSDTGTLQTPNGDPLIGEDNERSNFSFHGSVGWDLGDLGQLRFSGNYFREEEGGQGIGGDGAGSLDRSTRSNPVIPDPEFHPAVDENKNRNLILGLSYDVEDVLPNTDFSLTAFLQDRNESQRVATVYFYQGLYSGGAYSGAYTYLIADDNLDDRIGFRSGLTTNLSFGERDVALTYGVDWQKNDLYRPRLDNNNTDQVIGTFAPEVSLTTLSFYGQAQIDLTERLLLNAGVRHDRFSGSVGDRGLDEFVQGFLLPNAEGPLTDQEIFDEAISAGFADTGDIPKDDITLFNVGLVYDYDGDTQFYFGFSQGAEINQLGREARRNADINDISLDPAKTNQYEVGFRTAGDNWSATGAFFMIRTLGATRLVTNPGDPTGPLINVRQAERIEGFEGTLDYRFTDEINAGLNFTYQGGNRVDGNGRTLPIQYSILSPTRLAGYVRYLSDDDIEVRLDALHFFAGNRFSPEDIATAIVPPGASFEDNNNTEAYTVIDLTAVIPVWERAKVIVGIENLLNESFTPADRAASINPARASSLAQGRAITVAFRWGF